MKHIVKNPEPESFTHWKRRQIPGPVYESLYGTDARKDLVEGLLCEQGHICCYCMGQIDSSRSHIEHLKPRSQFPDLQVEYTNLLASCNGANGKHCGPRKKDWYDESLLVSPLDSGCETRFRFTAAGEILPCTDDGRSPQATETIRRLGLDNRTLTHRRKEQIQTILRHSRPWTRETIGRLLEAVLGRDPEGHFQPFCIAVAHVLRNSMSALS